jgi:transposase
LRGGQGEHGGRSGRDEKRAIKDILRGVVGRLEAARVLEVSLRTIQRYLRRYLEGGDEALRDRRRGHHRKLTETDEAQIVACKGARVHRSARFIRDHLRLVVSEETVRLVLVKHGLNRISLPPVKPIQRFVAEEPNDLWQIDIMGRVRFSLVGDLYLILALDDHSRFILSGAFFFRQFKLNVFLVLYRAFVRWGIPKAILSDRGSQFRSHHGQGEADYEWYAKKLGVELIYANRAQTKGKIERLFRFIQRDFVMENLHLTSLEEINTAFERWIEDYNFNHSNKALDKECAAGVYSASPRRLTAEELEFILVHEEPRKVLKTGAITYYGQYYKVPDAYIGRRVWTKLKGDTLLIESAKKVIAEHQIRHDRFDGPL